MPRSFGLKAGLLVVMLALCLCVSAVNAGELASLDWTSPTTALLTSVFMVGGSDGWAVGYDGTIIRWTGTEWIPEFPTVMLMPVLISVTLVLVILAKTTSKKRREPSSPNKTEP